MSPSSAGAVDEATLPDASSLSRAGRADVFVPTINFR
jgi:hypothetical protein